MCVERCWKWYMNINNINVNKYPLSQIFDPDSKVVFEIPKYQREYIWGSSEWEALFDDLMENDDGYFLGSIICINTATDTINGPKFEVVDGQQRLTTLSLLLAALYTVLNSNKKLLDEDQQADILQLKRRIVLKKTKADIRVIPQVQGNNYSDYLGLLSKAEIIPQHPMPSFAGLRRIVKGYNYFLKRINVILENVDDSKKVSEMFKVLDKVNYAIIVMIEVSNHSDAYTLFESLNHRGVPLTAVDLIKNMLLARLDAKEKGNLDYYFARWTEILNNLGDEYSDQERFFRQNYNAFRRSLNVPFNNEKSQYPLGTVATRSNLLDIYENIITKDPVGALEELSKNAFIYAGIILNKKDALTSFQRDCYQDLLRVQGAPSYLLLLYLIKYSKELDINENDIVKICKLLINFFVRRNLTDIPPTRDLSRMFMSYIEEIEEHKYIGDAIYENLRNVLVRSSASDEVFEQKLRGPVYDDNVGATRFILCMMAKRSMTVENEKDLWRKTNSNQYVWSIEHIFPQGANIPKDWVDMIADGDVVKAKEYQSLYVHTFGNLTITGYNSTLGNKPFAEKKERKDVNGQYIGYRNGLNLNDDVCDKDEWTIDIIKARTERMVSEILTMFKL